MRYIPGSNPDGPARLRNGETIARALERLLLNGITYKDVYFEAKVRASAAAKGARNELRPAWMDVFASVLEDWDEKKFPRPVPPDAPAGPVRDPEMERALKEAGVI